jgi:hypothetical protein
MKAPGRANVSWFTERAHFFPKKRRGASIPRSHRLCRPQAHRFNPAGFSIGFGGFGKLLLLLKLALGRRWRSRPTKSGGPPLFEPSLKVEGYKAHHRNSGFAVLPSVTISSLTASERLPQGIRIGHPCDGSDRPGHQPAEIGLTSALGRRSHGPCGRRRSVWGMRPTDVRGVPICFVPLNVCSA